MFLKRLGVFCLVLFVLMNSVLTFCDTETNELTELTELGVITVDRSGTDMVRREDCIVSIMRLGGLTDESVADLFLYSSNAIETPFSSFDDFNYGRDPEVIPASDGRNVYYAELAFFYKIIIGAEEERKRSTVVFHPQRTVSVNECVAFMVRCLCGVGEGTSLEDTFQIAKAIGLLQPEDSFYNQPTAGLCYSDFYVLLNRMINERRYIYFVAPTLVKGRIEGKMYDENREMTYLEYLKSMREAEEAEAESGESESIEEISD